MKTRTLRLASSWPVLMALAACLWLAPVSQALPRLCDVVCTCSGSCLWLCSATNGGYSVTTCGAWGICRNECGRAPRGKIEASLTFLTDGNAPNDGSACGADQNSTPATPVVSFADLLAAEAAQ